MAHDALRENAGLRAQQMAALLLDVHGQENRLGGLRTTIRAQVAVGRHTETLGRRYDLYSKNCGGRK